jgi:hypothetical protein
MDDEAILDLMHSAFIKHNTETNERFSFEEFYTIISKYYARSEK